MISFRPSTRHVILLASLLLICGAILTLLWPRGITYHSKWTPEERQEIAEIANYWNDVLDAETLYVMPSMGIGYMQVNSPESGFIANLVRHLPIKAQESIQKYIIRYKANHMLQKKLNVIRQTAKTGNPLIYDSDYWSLLTQACATGKNRLAKRRRRPQSQLPLRIIHARLYAPDVRVHFAISQKRTDSSGITHGTRKGTLTAWSRPLHNDRKRPERIDSY